MQEMIDIADFAVGLSRQLYGLTMHSERPHHRLYEQWHPLGLVGIVTAFNFPVAVWSWNALIAAACGDVVIWKPSSKTPLTALAVMNLIAPVVDKYDLQGVFNVLIGRGSEIGERLINDRRLPLISATGSCDGAPDRPGGGGCLGRSLLELGGKNAVIVTEDADQEMAVRAVLFGAVGPAGQRCTSTRRLIIHRTIKDEFLRKLVNAYKQVTIGDPLADGVLMGPLIDESAVGQMIDALSLATAQGARIVYGGEPGADSSSGTWLLRAAHPCGGFSRSPGDARRDLRSHSLRGHLSGLRRGSKNSTPWIRAFHHRFLPDHSTKLKGFFLTRGLTAGLPISTWERAVQK